MRSLKCHVQIFYYRDQGSFDRFLICPAKKKLDLALQTSVYTLYNRQSGGNKAVIVDKELGRGFITIHLAKEHELMSKSNGVNIVAQK